MTDWQYESDKFYWETASVVLVAIIGFQKGLQDNAQNQTLWPRRTELR